MNFRQGHPELLKPSPPPPAPGAVFFLLVPKPIFPSPLVTFPRHFHQDVQGGNKGRPTCSPESHQFHPPEISLLRDFCGTRSTLQKIKSENVATKKRFQGKILRFFNPKINEHATKFSMHLMHLLEF